ncbi:hypothetical protein MKZ38_002530 [Zalerion maritima]|uniref:FYVE-type domain-containing protein n=1 Tax=Zalerion maritima TaxID=339359 RepID=A0AAD5RNW5_9PEZI|nr:hypothetical protein MKZ38_002530 [Zalerion maritima]
MSARKLGGGRILGSGKGLDPSPAPSPPASSSGLFQSVRASSPNPVPSDSSGDSPANLDLTSTILEDDASSSNGGRPGRSSLHLESQSSSSSRLVCPICDEEMLTLLQLNRHLDDVHQSLPELEQDEVRSWFDKQVLKAKRFQPLSLFVATQKLRGLEVFESNESLPLAAPSSSFSAPIPSAPVVSRGPADPPSPIDPDDLITRKHWQRSTPSDVCTEPTCGKNLGPLVGSVNCRSCGKLFCEQHTMYQMKLSRAASHEPTRGYWARVCETCYKTREGYNDHVGSLVDHTAVFKALRRRRVDRQNLEIARLEKRLTKLTRLLANPPPEDTTSQGEGEGRSLVGLGSNVLGTPAQNRRKALEQTVVAWEDDKTVPKCPYCQQEFTWTFRRHHCRICGRVVCSDLQTSCSVDIPLTVSVSPSLPSEKPSGNNESMDLNVRMCRECRHTVFSKRDFLASVCHKPPDQRAYETLQQFEKGIRLLMPTFHKVLAPLQATNDGGLPPSHAQIQEASKIRKRLTDSFQKYDLAARRLRDLPTHGSSTQEKLQKIVYQAAGAFLHAHMLPLKSLPRMLKPGRPNGAQMRRLVPSSLRHEESSTQSSPSALAQHPDSGSVAGSEASTVVSLLEQEEKELRERLAVLEEQKFMVQTMVKNAQGQRRFEEVSALTRNAEELDGEIEQLRRRVKGVEGRWEEVYANGSA